MNWKISIAVTNEDFNKVFNNYKTSILKFLKKNNSTITTIENLDNKTIINGSTNKS